jgi:hypothetical protein
MRMVILTIRVHWREFVIAGFRMNYGKPGQSRNLVIF